MVARGFEGVRPAHGFAFVRLAPDGASVGELAVRLGVTKQAASQMVEELVRKGYVERRAAEEAAAEVVGEWGGKWGEVLGEGGVRVLREGLGRVGGGGGVRPVW
ncbi:MarR family transcriptional regulator [Streptomyces roseirectus]|uniref:MarR family transcriptional regulator n=1 Tax=Streptomyces roseirectus TaxID=2768066 RepID=A0A7H0ILA5_9ACTN|nr:MarR family transcriptional regulator [Streptomyces roseirectus]